VLLCTSSAIIFAAIFAQNVVVPPLADQVLHSGPVGFGWINAAWAIGAFLSAGFVPTLVRRFGVRGSVGLATGLVAAGCAIVPLFSRLWAALLVFLLMGAARGVSVVGLNTGLMEAVPEHYMGRVQNTFAIVSRLMQIVIGMTLGVIAHTIGLFAAFCGLAMVYAIAAIAAAAARSPSIVFEQSAAQTAVVETP
jgi:MFS family permease